MNKLDLKLGAMCTSIREQVKEQLDYSDDTIPWFDKDSKALLHLYIRGIITDKEHKDASKRLMKKRTQKKQEEL